MRECDAGSCRCLLTFIAVLVCLMPSAHAGDDDLGEVNRAVEPGEQPVLGSPSYKMKRVTVSTLAGYLTSASVKTTIVASPVIGSAGRCPGGNATSTGFWSMLGVTDVPVVLYVDRPDAPAEGVVLNWSGRASLFDIYRVPGRDGLGALPSSEYLLLTTGDCDASDLQADDFNLLFYNVIPTGD